MVNFSDNQRYAQRYFSGSWIEEVLGASGVAYDDSSGIVTSGQTEVQGALEALDSTLSALSSPPASGALIIEEVVNVSGVSSSSLGNIETIQFGNSGYPTAGFSFVVFAAPVDAVQVKVLYAPTTSGQTGTAAFDLEYNIFEQGDDLTPASEFPNTLNATSALVPANFEQLRQFNFPIPNAQFAGMLPPYVVNARLVRNTGSDSFSGDIDVAKIYADGVPGASAGTDPGYTGGNLTVDGDLTVENAFIYEAQGVAVPASSADAGTEGTFVYDGNYLYIRLSSQWVRVGIAQF